MGGRLPLRIRVENRIYQGAIDQKVVKLESVHNQVCPKCGNPQLNVYFSDKTDDRLGAWCESCDMKAYYCGEKSVLLN